MAESWGDSVVAWMVGRLADQTVAWWADSSALSKAARRVLRWVASKESPKADRRVFQRAESWAGTMAGE